MPRLLALSCLIAILISCNNTDTPLTSPDGSVKVNVSINPQGQPFYTVQVGDQLVIDTSQLGIRLASGDFSAHLQLKKSAITKVQDQYELRNFKKSANNYEANEQAYTLTNSVGESFNIVFRISNNGVAFRYAFPQLANGTTVNEERTSFHFPKQTRAWLQRMAVAKTGWEQTNPSYEEHYEQEISVGTPESTNTGWVYPALFKVDSTWVLISESNMQGNYCGTRLAAQSPNGEYQVAFPDPKEVLPNGDLKPFVDHEHFSPWRVIAIGSLAEIAESSLGVDLAAPAIDIDSTFIKPGKASWSWINSKDDFIVFDEQKKYIDYAADMQWEYCLVDVNWDQKIGYDRMEELARYALSKNVGLLAWYNSAGDWNTVKYTPKDRLLTADLRKSEFSKLQAMGIKGVKIDFFGGDGQSVMQYYIDILNDAAKHGLLVNFHGATLPRGWARTYPNLMTTEAVRGFEMVTFGQEDADKQATHCAMLPFTRNVFDPMDFTPMNLTKINSQVTRKTTPAFELATSVLFWSGIQHFAESPEGMATVHTSVKDFLRQLPASWTNMKYLDGYPGKLAVIARQSGNRWIVAGINGENSSKSITLDLRFLQAKKARLFGDDTQPLQAKEINLSAETSLQLAPNGGFVIEAILPQP